jgi:hypothetical protein
VANQFLELRGRHIARPPDKRVTLHTAEAERRLDRIDQHGNIGAPSHRPAGLVVNELPFVTDAAGRP